MHIESIHLLRWIETGLEWNLLGAVVITWQRANFRCASHGCWESVAMRRIFAQNCQNSIDKNTYWSRIHHPSFRSSRSCEMGKLGRAHVSFPGFVFWKRSADAIELDSNRFQSVRIESSLQCGHGLRLFHTSGTVVRSPLQNSESNVHLNNFTQ